VTNANKEKIIKHETKTQIKRGDRKDASYRFLRQFGNNSSG